MVVCQVGLISLLLKQDTDGIYKDPVYLKNLKAPYTSMLWCKNTIKCIALRIKRVLQGIVHPDQTYILHGRYIGDNIGQLLEIIEHHETSKKPGLVFIADFEKAFEKVRLDFIYKCLFFFPFRWFSYKMGRNNV